MVDVQHCIKTLSNCGITTVSLKYSTLPKTLKFFLYSLITLVGNTNVRPLLWQRRLRLTHSRNSKQYLTYLITILNNANNQNG